MVDRYNSRESGYFHSSVVRALVHMPNPDDPEEFEFDAALSFAGTERHLAAALASELKARGLRVFYDKDHAAHLWGKGTSEFQRVYGPASRFVIPFISAEYVKRDWTILEFETAKREAKKRRQEFILPLRVDDSRLLGLHDDCNHLSIDQFTTKQIADALIEKMPSDWVRAIAPVKHQASPNYRLLSKDGRQALGLIVTAVAPMPTVYLKQLFPAFNWASHCQLFRRSNFIKKSETVIKATAGAARSFTDATEQKEFNQLWIAALTPFAGHVDLSLFLAIHLMRDDKIEEAANLVASVAEETDVGLWVQAYITLLTGMANASTIQKLTPETRLHVLNALGTCHSQNETPTTALKCFDELQRKATKLADRHWVGQALLNKGVMYHKLDNRALADQWYNRALAAARENDDPLFISKCLTNLAQLHADDAPEESLTILKEAIELKKAIRDDFGLAFAYEVMAVAHARLERFDAAIKYYTKSDKIAERLGATHLRCLLSSNLGQTLAEAGRPSEALKVLRRGRRIATKQTFIELELRFLELEVTVAFNKGDIQGCKESAHLLLNAATKAALHAKQICARHAIAVTSKIQDQPDEADRHFDAATKLARQHQETDLLVRCILDRSRKLEGSSLVLPDIDVIEQNANAEEKRGNFLVSGTLWREIGRIFTAANAVLDIPRTAYEKSFALLSKMPGAEADCAEILGELSALLWSRGEFETALLTLQQVQDFARSKRLLDWEFAAVSQWASSLTELGRYSDAASLHKSAISLARRTRSDEKLYESLHNCAESLNRAGQAGKAISMFEQAEAIARSRGDTEGEISSAHSRALAIRNLGDAVGASAIFEQCRRRAKKSNLWHEYVRAVLAKANLAQIEGNLVVAETAYRLAMHEAKSHGLVTVQPMIAINLSSLLRKRGRVQSALRLLESYISAIEFAPDAHIYFIELAEMYLETGNVEAAKECWEAGKKSAAAAQDVNVGIFCSTQLVELLIDLRQFKPAEVELESLLSLPQLETDDRVMALSQLVRVLFGQKNDSRAEEVFEEAARLSHSKTLFESYSDLHMVAFDYYWDGNRSVRLDALKAYVVAAVAIMNHASDDVMDELLGEVQGHALRRLLEKKLSARLLDWLRNELQCWLKDQLKNAFIIKMILWPLAIAQRLNTVDCTPRNLRKKMGELLNTFDIDADIQL